MLYLLYFQQDKMKELTSQGMSEEDSFRQVMGPEHPGSVRCGGRSVSISDWYGHRKGGGETLGWRLSAQIKGLETQLMEERSERRKIEEKFDTLSAQMEERDARMQQENARMQLQMQRMIQLLDKPSDHSMIQPRPPPGPDEDGAGVPAR